MGFSKKYKVSLVIPVFNEEKYIEKALDAIFKSDFDSSLVEVLLVDGMSTDSTREKILEYQTVNPSYNIQLIDNEKKIKPTAFNLGLENAKGKYLLFLGCHAAISKNYLSVCVEKLEKNPEVVAAGGIMKIVPQDKNFLANIIASFMSSKVGMGVAKYRAGVKSDMLVDTVFGAMYRTEVLRNIGYMDEQLIRGQDKEYNVRLRRHSGKDNILLTPDTELCYFPRSKLALFLKHMFYCGLSPFFVSRIISKRIYSRRNYAPIIFVLFFICMLLLSFVSTFFVVPVVFVLVLYALATLFYSNNHNLYSFNVLQLLALPVVFFMAHISYGLGSIWGLFKPIKKDEEWSSV